MSSGHPFWPDYVPKKQHSSSKSISASASTLRKSIDQETSTTSTQQSVPNPSASLGFPFHSTAQQRDSFDRRPKRSSLDRSSVHVGSSASSPSPKALSSQASATALSPTHRASPVPSVMPSANVTSSPVSESGHRRRLSGQARFAPEPSSSYVQPSPSSLSSSTRFSTAQSDPSASPVSSAHANPSSITASMPLSSRQSASFVRLRSGSESIHCIPRAIATSNAEVSIDVLVWWPSTTKTGSSTLARAPLFRDAASVKQKLSLRQGSYQSRASEPPHEPVFERASFGLRSGGYSWLREKPSKARLNSPSSSVAPVGQWKRGILLFRENGSLYSFGEGNALAHSLTSSALSASDIKCVDDSLFDRPRVLAIYPRQSRQQKQVSITTRKQEAALLNDKPQRIEPVFVEFKSDEQLQYVKALLRIYARPEIFGSAATVGLGGTHRFSRRLDITISDAKSIMPKWPVEVNQSFPEPVPSSSFLPSSPSTPAGGFHNNSSDLPRSFSHYLSSLRHEDHDDSPASEQLTEDGFSGSSRGGSHPGSHPGSRPGSRLRHNAKPSVSSLHMHQDLDDTIGSGSSRPASRSASHYDSQSQNGDDASSNGEPVSGPVSGHAGASRFANMPIPISGSSPNVSAGLNADVNYTPASRAAAQRRDDKDRFEKSRFDRYCRIRLDGELVARTSLSQSSVNAFAVDKFQLKDLGDVKSLMVEVLHPTQKSSSSLAGTPSASAHKYVLLGIVEIPIETLRRNEEVEGRFPIWSVSTFASQTVGDEDLGRTPQSFHQGVVGELSMSIHFHEEVILPLSMYEEVYRRIHEPDSDGVIRQLATTMREDLIISHLVRIYTASGTIAEQFTALVNTESSSWGEKLEPELLFRANTLLSRSLDHFQRLLALSWLEDCLGPTVRKICQGPGASSRPDTGVSTGGSSSGDAHFDFSTSIRSPPLLPANAIDTIPDGPITPNALRKLSETMWQNIYSQRHCCPPDLRSVLHMIRSKVNERYQSTKSTRPGIQGVGAFVFLRLFCAALNAPQLYGLTPSQPARGAQRKLLLLSKVLLALASKKTAFDKDKDWELLPLNDLLQTYSSEYDDFISVVSTEPPTAAPVQLLGTRIEDDAGLQAAAWRRLNALSPLHRESIPRAPYMLDQPQALAAFVSFIANAADQHENQVSKSRHGGCLDGSATTSEEELSEGQSEAERIRRKTDEFIQICCQIEEAAGMCIEQAGYDARPIPIERLQRAVRPLRSQNEAAAAASSSPITSSWLRGGDIADTSIASFTSSTSSFGTVVEAPEGGEASPRSSPGRTRNRSATVSATRTRVKADGYSLGGVPDLSVERKDFALGSSSSKGTRRQSVGTSHYGRRPSQTGTEADSPNRAIVGQYVAGAPPARRMSELSANLTPPRRPSSGNPAGMAAGLPVSQPYVFGAHRDEDNDHGSDDELRQAYRALHAEQETVPQRIMVPTGLSVGPGAMTPSEPLRESRRTPQALGLDREHALLEAEDGSTFESVYPKRGYASHLSSGPPPSRSARQSMELGRPGSDRASLNVGMPTVTQGVTSQDEGGVVKKNDEALLAERRLGSRASFTAASKSRQGSTSAASSGGNQAESNRRHSTDEPTAPRNWSLPQPGAGRTEGKQHGARDSSDGFEATIEDAYAQTRASLPPSASMPIFQPSAASVPAQTTTGRYRSGTESGQGKKKKWWKP